MSFQIGDRTVGEQSPCFIIAEIGQNHQGDLSLAKQMILEAKVYARAEVINEFNYEFCVCAYTHHNKSILKNAKKIYNTFCNRNAVQIA